MDFEKLSPLTPLTLTAEQAAFAQTIADYASCSGERLGATPEQMFGLLVLAAQMFAIGKSAR